MQSDGSYARRFACAKRIEVGGGRTTDTGTWLSHSNTQGDGVRPALHVRGERRRSGPWARPIQLAHVRQRAVPVGVALRFIE